MTKECNRLRELFDQAIQLPNGAERETFLEGINRDDPELGIDLKNLIDAYFHAGSFLEIAPEVTQSHSPDRVGSREQSDDHEFVSTGETDNCILGSYRLKKKIGEGGYGVVYAAEQLQPVRRDVAIKLIKPGMDSKEVISRFNLERQALAVMEHPAIATILDAGTADTGNPYFVMELVDGISITQYCDRYRLTLQQRLELFILVCNGVQHAHQKGVIHRDLKPANIMVTEQDSRPLPKIIDFGIAKAVDHMQGFRTQETGRWQLVGTPIYMSPEQAASRNKLIDARSDIYSLGIVLYELLTGQTPITSDESSDLSFTEFLEQIRTGDTPKPSSQLSSSNTNLHDVAKKRQIAPKRLQKLVAGDLDWIVDKALARDIDDRYESAGAFARDVERFIADEPIEAGPPSATYRLKKFVRKHWISFATSAAFLAVLIGATTFSVIQAMHATHNSKVAKAALDSESKAKEKEMEQKEVAVQALKAEEKRRKQFEEIYNVMMSTYELQSPTSTRAEISIRDIQDLRKRAVLSSFDEYPTTKVNVLVALAKSYIFLRLTDEAEPLLLNALKICNEELSSQYPEIANINIALTKCYLVQDRFEDVIQICQKFLRSPIFLDEDQRHSFHENLGTAFYMSSQYVKAIKSFEQAVKLVETPGRKDVPRLLQTWSLLSMAYLKSGETEDAIKLLSTTLQLAKDSDKTQVERAFSWLIGATVTFFQMGHEEIARSHALELMTISNSNFGEDHPSYTICLTAIAKFDSQQNLHLAAIGKRERVIELCLTGSRQDFPTIVNQKALLGLDYTGVGQREEGLKLSEEAIGMASRFLNVANQVSIEANVLYAIQLERNGKYDQALKSAKSSLRLAERHLGKSHPTTLMGLEAVARLSMATGNFLQSFDRYHELVGSHESVSGPHTLATLNAQLGLAQAFCESGQTQKGLKLVKRTHQIMLEYFGTDHVSTWQHAYVLAVATSMSGNTADAIALLKETLQNQLRLRKPGHLDIQSTLRELSVAHQRSDRLKESRNYLSQALQLARKNWGDNHPKTIQMIKDLGLNESELGNMDAAIVLFSEVLELRKAARGEQDPETLNSLQLLGEHYLRADRFDEAEQAYDELFAILREGVGEQVERLIDPYALTGRDFRNLGQLKTSLKYYELALQACKAKFPNTLLSYAIEMDTNLAIALLASTTLESNPEEASKTFESTEKRLLDCFDRTVEILKNMPKKEQERHTRATRYIIFRFYEVWGKPELAEEWYDEEE